MKESLTASLFLFEVCARRAVESLLGAPTRAVRIFRFSTTFSSPSSTSCIVRTRSPEFEVSVVLGFETSQVAALVPDPATPERRMDAMGEVTNVLAGTYLGHPLFCQAFGECVPSVPIFIPGANHIEETCCLQGTLEAVSARLYAGVRIRPIAS